MSRNKRLSLRLLEWFEQNRRSLPWRDSGDPYRIWISEIMLQQTQAERGARYFQRWIERFPDILHVASASEDEILGLWEGLGYYSRALNAHKTAKIIANDFGGKFPDNRGELEALPGIGSYTAGAILSMAFGYDEPAVDANAVRVFARLFDIDEPPSRPKVRKRIEKLAKDGIPSGKAAAFNQALMDFGSLICRPKGPKCGTCPLADDCEALALGVVADRPLPAASAKIVPVVMVTGVLEHEGRYFVQKRLPDGIWANLWEFPGGRIEPGEEPEAGVVREFSEETGFSTSVKRKAGVIKHGYTKYRVTMHAFMLDKRCNCPEPILTAATEFKWADPEELETLPFPSAQRKLIAILKRQGLLPGDGD